MPKVLTCPHCYKKLLSSTYVMWNHIIKNHPEKCIENQTQTQIQKQTQTQTQTQKQKQSTPELCQAH
jgi:hypothetical protein